MNIDKIKKYKQVDGSINYSIDGLNDKQANDLFLVLCDLYDKVDKYLIGYVNGKWQGYFNCI